MACPDPELRKHCVPSNWTQPYLSHRAGEQLKELSNLMASKAVTDKQCEELEQDVKHLRASVDASEGAIQTLRQQVVSMEEAKVRAAATGD